MLRGPSAAPDGKPIGALEAPIRWVKVLDLVNHCPNSLVRRSPPTPLAMGATVEHMESHKVSILTHRCAFLNIPVHMTRATRREGAGVGADSDTLRETDF